MAGTGYSIGDHPADLEITARGQDLKELFINTARGVLDYTTPGAGTGAPVFRDIHLTAADREELLVLWLNELIFLLETEEIGLPSLTITHISDRELRATLRGAKFAPGDPPRGTEVKAATYYQLAVRKIASGWESHVILDL